MWQRVVAVFLTSLALGYVGARAEGENDAISLPDNDLPSAFVAGDRAAFMRNGALVVGKDGRWLFDIGLSYAMPGWKEWGTQIRRSDDEDSWQPGEQKGRQLVSRGTLFDINRVKRFKFTQRTGIIPGGLRLEYEITPLRTAKVQEFGFTVHLPIAETTGAHVSLWPGFYAATLPMTCGRDVLQERDARGAIVYASGKPLFSLVGPAKMRWKLTDDRAWQLNTFRIIGSDARLVEALGRGEAALFHFDLLLGDAAAQRLSLGPGQCEVDRSGRLAIYAGDQKILEGGVARPGRLVEWLFEYADLATVGLWYKKGDSQVASGVSRLGEMSVRHEIEVTPQDGSAILTYRLGKEAPDKSLGGVSLAFAVPVPQLTGPPAPKFKTERQASAGKGVGGEEPVGYTLSLSLKNGAALDLTAGGQWETTEAILDGTKCYVLTTPLRPVGTGPAEAGIRLQMGPSRATGENRQ